MHAGTPAPRPTAASDARAAARARLDDTVVDQHDPGDSFIEAVTVAEREMPAGLNDERSLLNGWVDYYRATLLLKCEGLTGEQLIKRSCEPSPMSLIGLVRHMTEMERVYGHRLADWEIGWLYCTDENEEGDFEAATAAGAAEDLETFRAHCARTREIMAAHQLDDTFGKQNSHTLRWFYLYLIKEYARHLGHADLLRERIDGATGE
jgi:hypothetical protein